MAADYLTPGARVIGFSGTPVRGGAGIKPAVLEDPPGRFFADIGRRPDASYDAVELESFIERGLLCRIPHPGPPISGGVFLYAHEDFVRSGDGSLDLPRAVVFLERHEPLGIYFRYLPFRRARDELKQWGEELLDNARKQARCGELRRALGSAERAGYAVLPDPSTHRRDHDFNRRVFVYLCAAYKGLERDAGPVLDDARIDFSEDVVGDINRAAEDLFRDWKVTRERPRSFGAGRRFGTHFVDATPR